MTAPPQLPWYFRKKFIIFVFLLAGPLAFPFFWFSPQFKKNTKIWVTVVLSVLMAGLSYASGKLMDYLLQQLNSQGIL